ncbi:Coenzyme F420 hydrogenase/dehydrogenase, beta subunit C-terminal domain [Pontibacterium granulatum]|uniref:Coenzyme F420 hydrogenase/dehydrogenase, beta subunit C-terminal domain n=1 Tax=Pontibacterium granulatum TaxID=2036029 RepID=UPI00249AF17F|nr:Coenzyme F420 hydrogenase/dehydrogenase, beta subunit C-terminal domain [Pontibacterium granulatum]MDI3324763.1 Coenzyme F420 hydrogenase/dehydrogenase, beta subunit C-terminal domain [Pontibacterium granulatum]
MLDRCRSAAKDRLYRIVEEGMCTGCGLCQSVAGEDSIQIRTQATGYKRPVVVGDLSDETVDTIYQVCPGINVSQHLPADASASEDLIWGRNVRNVMAWTAQPDVRFKASTGGVMTGLAQYLVASGDVDFILHVKASDSEPAFGERHLSFTNADVIEASGSRYGPAAPLLDIGPLLDRGQAFAFIGKPCDVSALNNYARIDPRVDELVRYKLAIVCGGYLTPDSFNGFLEQAGVPRKDLARIRYRGNGCPGPVEIENAQGEVFFRSYNDFWGEGETNWSIPFRCKICPNGIGEGADIAAADSWPDCQVDSATEKDDPGSNAVIVRTSSGNDLMNAAVEAGFIETGDEITPRDMDFFQPHQVLKKQAGMARIEGLVEEGGLGIRCKGHRLAQIADTMDEDFLKRQRDGTRRRFRAGDSEEPTPV